MKAEKEKRCPGCKRHCSAKNPQCKYGRTYFAKQRKTRYKWENYVEQGSLMWKLLFVSRYVKKKMSKGEGGEQQFLERLTEDEQKTLTAILDKLDGGRSNKYLQGGTKHVK